MGIPNKRHRSKLKLSLYIFGISGLAGIMVDIDHIFAYYGFQYTEGIWAFRPLHIPLAIIACGVAIYCCSCLRRLAHRNILNNEK